MRPVRLASHSAVVPEANVTRTVNQLARMLGDETRERDTHSPTRRLNLRGTLTGRAPFRERYTVSAGTLGVALVIDCSGSMADEMAEARVLVAALSALACRRLVRSVVILSAVYGRNPHQTVLALPVAPDTIGRLEGNGDMEGLETALLVTAPLLRTLDLTLVYTDGQIGDTPVNRARLAHEGIAPIGCYAGDPSMQTAIARWFAPVLIAPTAEALAADLIRTRRRHTPRR